MKTSCVVGAAFKIVGIVFFLKTLIAVPATITAITIYINGLVISHESISDFSFTITFMTGFMLLLLSLTTILILYSDGIARYLVKSNDRDVGINPHWKVPDILFIGIQIIAIIFVVEGFGYFLKNTAKGVYLLFNLDILKEVPGSGMKFEIGSELIAGLFNLIFGVALFLLSHRITNFLDRFNRKGARPNHVFQRDR